MTNKIIRTCSDVIVKQAPKSAKERMALVKDATWGPAYVLRIRFLDGDPDVQAKVRDTAKDWLNYANIKFVYVADGDADIRISFAAGGSWSYMGRQGQTIPGDKPTMNYGWLDKNTADDEYSRVVLHEFGHALGCIHEHQHPAGGIHWNKPVVYDYYKKTNGWDPPQVDAQVFAAYDETLLVETKAADPESIMMYPIPPGFADNIEVGWNRDLSATDKTFIRNVYPF